MSEEATLDEFVNPEGEESEETEQPELIQGVAWSTIKSVPEEWTVNNVESDIDILSGNNFSSEYFVEKGGIPLIRIRDLAEDDTTVNFDGEYDSRYLINQQDLLVGMDGEFEPHLWAGPQALLNQRVCKIEPKSQYNKIFFRYAIEKPLFYIQKSIAGTTVKHLSQSNINDLNLPTPPLPEQRKIATVLHTVDRAVEKTEAIIEQIERLEKGTIQALLSDGTRNSVAKKDTPIGEVPEHWNVRQVGDLTNVTVGYVQNIDGHFTNSDDGIRLYRTKDISSRGLQVQDESYVTQEFHVDNKGSQLTAGDLIVARHGDSGQAAVIPESTPEAHCQNVVIVRSSEEFVSKFLEYLFNYEVTRQRLLAWKAGSVQKVVSTTAVQNFRIPLPPIEEQNEIVEKLSSVNDRLENEDAYLQTLHTLKRGLMQDLLSGTVRTTDTNIEVPEEIAQYG